MKNILILTIILMSFSSNAQDFIGYELGEYHHQNYINYSDRGLYLRESSYITPLNERRNSISRVDFKFSFSSISPDTYINGTFYCEGKEELKNGALKVS